MRITKGELRRIIHEALRFDDPMAYDFKMWAKRNIPSWPQLYAHHIALVKYAREHGLDIAETENLVDALGLDNRVRRLVRLKMSTERE